MLVGLKVLVEVQSKGRDALAPSEGARHGPVKMQVLWFGGASRKHRACLVRGTARCSAPMDHLDASELALWGTEPGGSFG